MHNICLKFPSKKINPYENFVEAAFDFNQMKSTWKFLSVKSRIICRGLFRAHSNSYHGAFFAKKMFTAFNRREQPPEVF